MNRVLFSSARTNWDTPDALYKELDAEFGFTYDPCPSINGEFALRQDGLLSDWGTNRVFLNPPYGSEIGAWMEKAFRASQAGATVVCLIPSRTDTRWWHDYVMRASEIRFLRGRLRFKGAKHPAPFPSAVVIFLPGYEP